MIWDRPRNKFLDEIATKSPNNPKECKIFLCLLSICCRKSYFLVPSWNLQTRIIDKWASKPWMGQTGLSASLCTICGHYSSKLALRTVAAKGQVDQGGRSSIPITPPHLVTAFPVTPCHFPEPVPVATCTLGTLLLATAEHQMSESQSSEWPYLWTAAQVEMAALYLSVTGVDNETDMAATYPTAR